jgi:tetratricopeptide (TPR) repeat protein
MNAPSEWKDTFRRAARLFRFKQLKPGDLVEMAIKAMESRRMVMKRGQAPIVPDEYILSVPGDDYDTISALKETLEKRIADQLRVYANDAGFKLNRNRVAVTIIRMPSSRRGFARAETVFSDNEKIKTGQPTEPADIVKMRFDGDNQTMYFGSMEHRDTWKNNYALASNQDMDTLHEIVRCIDTGNLPKAAEMLEKLLNNNPSHIGLWILNDSIRRIEGDDNAFDRLRSRALLVKDDPLLSSALAIMYLEDGDVESALWEAMEALNTNPGYPVPALALAQAYYELDMKSLAAERVRMMDVQNSNDPEIPDLMRRFMVYPKPPPTPAQRKSGYFRLRYKNSSATPNETDGHRDETDAIHTRKTSIVIGRAGGASDPDVALNDERVSSMHCRIINSNGLFYCIDCESRNGVFINDKKIDSWQLTAGDVIRLGNTELIFECCE